MTQRGEEGWESLLLPGRPLRYRTLTRRPGRRLPSARSAGSGSAAHQLHRHLDATVGAQWLLVDSPNAAALVSLVQVANTLPVMLLALPGGVLADSFDRRWLLFTVQAYFLSSASCSPHSLLPGRCRRPCCWLSPSPLRSVQRCSCPPGRPPFPNSCPGRSCERRQDWKWSA